ncbi:flagellin [Mucisphaera calidilacus]|uniref:Flagellin n=1 Tax=Mucisphaera calidilacus TaxID=2527982 RepID=A0A518BZH0_9BACT|nr:flagellin [Mucisphaera calidilacus]QDU72361.1 flagellar hook-associated protein FlgL [Mucisphaera calidilacus]
MSGVNPTSGRVTSLLSSSTLVEQLRKTQVDMADLQRQLSTGLKYDSVSDAPGEASSILSLRRRLLERDQELDNLAESASVLNTADQAIKDFKEIVLEARTLAQEAANELGGSDAESRKAQAIVVTEQLDALIAIANRDILGVPLFAGNDYTDIDEPFVEFLGGVRYLGADSGLRLDTGQSRPSEINSNGADAFGALTTRVASNVDLNPALTGTSRLATLDGARGQGITPGQVQISVGATSAVIDLAGSETADDIITRLTAAFDAITPGSAAITLTNNGFALEATGVDPVTISDLPGATSAADLGISITNTGFPPTAGGDLNPPLTKNTRLADLGVAVDFASGLVINQGSRSETITLAGLETVEDLDNAIRALDLGVRLEINAGQTGFNLISEVSGVSFSIGENGGTTATDLGLRSYSADTRLSDFRNGMGVLVNEGSDDLGNNYSDIGFRLHDGTSFDVDLEGLTTVGEVITAIENEAAAAGLTVGVDFVVGFKAVGNGLEITDNTAGGGDFEVVNLGSNLTADHLGIAGNAGAGNAIAGRDTATIRAENVFTHLMDLRDALTGDDTSGIALAMDNIGNDLNDIDTARANIATQASRTNQQIQRIEDMKLTEEILLSDLQDADLTEVVTRFTQLQQQLQASLTAGGQIQQLTLLNFLS